MSGEVEGKSNLREVEFQVKLATSIDCWRLPWEGVGSSLPFWETCNWKLVWWSWGSIGVHRTSSFNPGVPLICMLHLLRDKCVNFPCPSRSCEMICRAVYDLFHGRGEGRGSWWNWKDQETKEELSTPALLKQLGSYAKVCVCVCFCMCASQKKRSKISKHFSHDIEDFTSNLAYFFRIYTPFFHRHGRSTSSALFSHSDISFSQLLLLPDSSLQAF